jgi:integrase
MTVVRRDLWVYPPRNKESQSGRFPLGFAAAACKGGMLEQKKFYNGLRKFCQIAGVKRVSPHGLRHSYTEVWIKNGATVEDIRQLLGHKCPQTTLRYIHRTDDRLINLAKDFTF